MDRILLLLCSFLSCYIIISLLFQFMNESYERSYKGKYIYIVIKYIMIIALVVVNMLNNPFLNLLTCIMIVGVCACFLYHENGNGAQRRIIECEAVSISMCVCESLGVICLQWILQMLHVKIEDTIILQCLEVTFSKVVLIFLYYLGINRLVRKRNYPLSKSNYSIYVIIFVYSLVNMFLIVEEFMQREINYLWAVNMAGIVLADLYLLYFIKMSNDKNYYENLAKVLEQQANMQYEYYLLQEEKYNVTLQVLHDVNKHIKSIEKLYAADQGETAAEYAEQINVMLKPLMPTKYTGNPILDILLTDKAAEMKEKSIDFQISIENVDLKCIEPIDVTTIFGNLLDNAIEASSNVVENKYVYIKIGFYHRMISVKIENSSNYVKWKNGMPVSEKGKGRGLGILNVQRCISKYDGDMKLKWEDNKFIVEMFLNV